MKYFKIAIVAAIGWEFGKHIYCALISAAKWAYDTYANPEP